jgi:hypothetical protein
MGNQVSTCLGIKGNAARMQPFSFGSMPGKRPAGEDAGCKLEKASIPQSPLVETGANKGTESDVAVVQNQKSVPVHISASAESRKDDLIEAVGFEEALEPEACTKKSYLKKNMPVVDSQVEEIDLVSRDSSNRNDFKKESSESRVLDKADVDKGSSNNEGTESKNCNSRDDGTSQGCQSRGSQAEDAEAAHSSSERNSSGSAAATVATGAKFEVGDDPAFEHLITPPASPDISFTPHLKHDDASSVASSSASADEEAVRLLGSRRLRSVLAILKVRLLAPPDPRAACSTRIAASVAIIQTEPHQGNPGRRRNYRACAQALPRGARSARA